MSDDVGTYRGIFSDGKFDKTSVGIAQLYDKATKRRYIHTYIHTFNLLKETLKQ